MPARHDADRLFLFAMRFGETARLWRIQIDRRLRPLGISFPQWITLIRLARGGDGPVQKALARATGIDGPTMVGVLDRLVAAGLVERRVAAHDRRAKTVHLTPRGRAFLDEADRELAVLRATLLAGVPPATVARCTRLLETIAERAEAMADEP